MEIQFIISLDEGQLVDSHSDFLIHRSLVRWRLVEISALILSWLFLQAAPNSFSPSTAKLQSSKLGFSASSATQTSRSSSSRDQELPCATHCRVAVMKASGLKRPRNISH